MNLQGRCSPLACGTLIPADKAHAIVRRTPSPCDQPADIDMPGFGAVRIYRFFRFISRSTSPTKGFSL